MKATKFVQIDWEVRRAKGAIKCMAHAPDSPENFAPGLELGPKIAQEVVQIEVRVPAKYICKYIKYLFAVGGKISLHSRLEVAIAYLLQGNAKNP